MVQVSDEDDPTATRTRRQRSNGTLTYPPEPELPTLPFDLLPEILCRLPVKLLIQLRCLCKFFNSLISDPNFAKKHFQFSAKHHRLMVTSRNNRHDFVLHDSPIPSVFSTSMSVTQTQLDPPFTLARRNYVNATAIAMCSCDGIFCGELNLGYCFVWNPSIRKFKLLPPYKNPLEGDPFSISFGYDHFIDNYKVVAISSKYEVFVNALGTDYWRRIENIPYYYYILQPGIFVGGTVNWMASDTADLLFILSLHLEKESYQKLFLPDSENENDWWSRNLSVLMLRDCLCVYEASDLFFNVWIMKEYGNQESWTKLYSVPKMQHRRFKAYTISYIYEDDQLLLGIVDMQSSNTKLAVYDSKTGTLNIPEFEKTYEPIYSNVYIESLISP